MKNSYYKKSLLALLLLAVGFSGCKKDLMATKDAPKSTQSGKTLNAVNPYRFNWETVDFMPSGPGQAQIPPPWIGQGSITSVYGIDVANDHKNSDGWELVYNTFDPNAGQLQNPYFMLYNKFRGLLRVYLYVNSGAYPPSDYIVDGISFISNTPSSMLNFVGTDVVDASIKQSKYTQVEPAPADGSAPLATNKWYMLQYEIAYDAQMKGANYQNQQLSWFTNYNSIATVSLGGTATGTLSGTIGGTSNTLDAALLNGGKVAGTAVLSAIGTSFLSGKDAGKLGLPAKVFSAITDGVSGALKESSKGIPGAIVGILSGLFGGNSGPQTVSLNLNSTITLTGTTTSKGSFPASPTSVYVPGNSFTQQTQNFVPLYPNVMGVFNLTGRPTVNLHTTIFQSAVNVGGIPYNNILNEYTVDNLKFGTVFSKNDAVINANADGATIKNLRTEVVLLNPTPGDPGLYNFYGTTETIGSYTALTGQVASTSYTVEHSGQPFPGEVAVRVIFNVVPNNGGPQALIVKTFLADVVSSTTIVTPPPGSGGGGNGH